MSSPYHTLLRAINRDLRSRIKSAESALSKMRKDLAENEFHLKLEESRLKEESPLITPPPKLGVNIYSGGKYLLGKSFNSITEAEEFIKEHEALGHTFVRMWIKD